MRKNKKTRPILKGKKGVTAVLIAIVLVMILGFAALAIDIGYGMVTKNELQNIADSAALAATRQLGTIYQGMTYEEQLAYVVGSGDETLIKNAAINVASQNKAGGVNSIVISAADIFIGEWEPDGDPSTDDLNVTNSQPNAVRVIARRDSLVNGQIATFFAKIFGISGRDVTALATAAMTGMSTSDPGELELPVGISRLFFDEDRCGEVIQFNPTTTSCAGWTTWEYNSNTNIMNQILQGTLDSPETTANQSIFNFTGGNLSEGTFEHLFTLFQTHGYDIDADGTPRTTTGDREGTPLAPGETGPTGVGPAVPLLDDGGNQLRYPPCTGAGGCSGPLRYAHEWPTTVVVYQNHDGTADCSNPNQDRPIVGFARILINDVVGPPADEIRGQVECSYVEPTDSMGGGGPYGVLGPIPGLVE